MRHSESDLSHDIALFRYGVIPEFVSVPPGTKGLYARIEEKAAQEYSIPGTHRTRSDAHLPRYLAEFCYRFNRRFKLEDMVARLGYAAVRTPPMPQRLLGTAEARG